MKFNYIVWDLDGVMINGQEGVIKGVNYVLKTLNYPPMTPVHVQMLFTAPKVQVAFERICSVPSHTAVKYAEMYMDAYLNYYLLEARLQDGINNVIETLYARNMPQAIATNRHHECAIRLCQHFGFTEYCSPIIGSDGKEETTKSDIIRECLKTMGCPNPEEAIMLGDLPGDILCAEEVGMHFLGVNYGFSFHNVLGYANSPEEILTILVSSSRSCPTTVLKNTNMNKLLNKNAQVVLPPVV